MDVAVQTALLNAAVKKHPHMPLKKVIEKYWYEDAFGRHFYSLEDDRSVRVVKLVDTLLVVHPKMILDANPYIHTDYMEKRLHTREMQNVTGRYRAVWERQEGSSMPSTAMATPMAGVLPGMRLQRNFSVHHSVQKYTGGSRRNPFSECWDTSGRCFRRHRRVI